MTPLGAVDARDRRRRARCGAARRSGGSHGERVGLVGAGAVHRALHTAEQAAGDVGHEEADCRGGDRPRLRSSVATRTRRAKRMRAIPLGLCKPRRNVGARVTSASSSSPRWRRCTPPGASVTTVTMRARVPRARRIRGAARARRARARRSGPGRRGPRSCSRSRPSSGSSSNESLGDSATHCAPTRMTMNDGRTRKSSVRYANRVSAASSAVAVRRQASRSAARTTTSPPTSSIAPSDVDEERRSPSSVVRISGNHHAPGLQIISTRAGASAELAVSCSCRPLRRSATASAPARRPRAREYVAACACRPLRRPPRGRATR